MQSRPPASAQPEVELQGNWVPKPQCLWAPCQGTSRLSQTAGEDSVLSCNVNIDVAVGGWEHAKCKHSISQNVLSPLIPI